MGSTESTRASWVRLWKSHSMHRMHTGTWPWTKQKNTSWTFDRFFLINFFLGFLGHEKPSFLHCELFTTRLCLCLCVCLTPTIRVWVLGKVYEFTYNNYAFLGGTRFSALRRDGSCKLCLLRKQHTRNPSANAMIWTGAQWRLKILLIKNMALAFFQSNWPPYVLFLEEAGWLSSGTMPGGHGDAHMHLLIFSQGSHLPFLA